jgi:hypothetical protein
VGTIDIIGNSMGGAIAPSMAAARPAMTAFSPIRQLHTAPRELTSLTLQL